MYSAHLDGNFERDDNSNGYFLFSVHHIFSRTFHVWTIILYIMDSLGSKLIEFSANTLTSVSVGVTLGIERPASLGNT